MENYYKIAQDKLRLLKNKKEILILGVESSCDETSISVVKNGRIILSNVISTQIAIHRKFGGVVPEVASRNHLININSVLDESLKTAGVTLNDIDAIAVTYGAGLIGALLVGVNFAKALAYSLNVPLIAVSHVEGHICANYLSHQTLTPPFICLMVSGGHSAILKVEDYCKHTLLGSTIDDAAGEAFDKVARILGLPYPGGVEIDKLAKQGQNNIQFIKHSILPNSLDFSFSGIKTAVVNYVHTKKQKNESYSSADICASFQTLVTNELATKAVKACAQENLNKLVIAGGVGANSQLKETLQKLCDENGITLYTPDLKLCTDNAAMIASCGYYNLQENIGISDLSLTARPTVQL